MPPALEALLSERRLVTAEQMSRARLVQEESGERLDSVLTRLGLVPERTMAEAISSATGYDLVEAKAFPAEPVAAGKLSPRFLRDVVAAPLAESDAGVEVALANPLDRFAIDAIAFALGRPIIARVARAGDIEAALDRLYPSERLTTDEAAGEADDGDIERLKDMASDAPVVRAVNNLIARAAELRASDIHIEPEEDGLKVRFRIDGALVEQEPLPAHFRSAFVSRVKVMAELNIAERRLPQDGRIRQAVRGRQIDLRIATSPTIHGEAVVMRLLDRSHVQLDFASLGFGGETLDAYLRLLSLPHGIILVTGPTGSGKTTTLYASLATLNAPDRKILTIEDPIEYRLAGINQTQVNPQIGLTFAAALRSFLRQDPDTVMVGEIRDLETAQVAVQAALTGHGILSTLHTNSAASAVTRLLDMGVEPFLITSTINGVLAQRLVRRLCPSCREPHTADPAMLKAMGHAAGKAAVTLYRPRGCPACANSGFQGRVAILELIVMTEEVNRLVLSRAEAGEIQKAALAAGMRTMFEDGLAKAQAGLTTLDEVLRVSREA
ncbi:MAG: type II secretion system ATPase GspE [Caulobacteraceae bacterium]